MKGWGRFGFWLGLGIFVAGGCGGRTGMLGDGYEDDGGPDRAGDSAGGSSSAAGRPGRAGNAAVGGSSAVGGGVGTAGAALGGSYTAGAPYGGYASGGYAVGGYASGGYYGFGGSFGIAGSFPIAGSGFGGAPGGLECVSCLGRSCGFQLGQCFRDPGCLSIFDCMRRTGCQGFDCYDADVCSGVIDRSGGPGSPSMSLLLQAFSCAIQSGCDCG